VLTWTLYLLAQHPDVMKRIQAEVGGGGVIWSGSRGGMKSGEFCAIRSRASSMQFVRGGVSWGAAPNILIQNHQEKV